MTKLTPSVFSNDNAVDRVEETEYILNELLNNTCNVLIIYSISGVGKSTLTNRIKRNISNRLSVCVRTNPENKTNNITEGFFLGKIFNTLVKTIQDQKTEYPDCTFEYYLSHDKNNFIKKKALERMFGEIESDAVAASAGLSVTKFFISKLFQIYDYNPTMKLALVDRDSMLIASNYIKYVFSRQRFCFIMDNLQNIDSYSLQLLTDWIATSGNDAFFLFEYTLEEEGKTSPLLRLAKYWQVVNLDVKLLPLEGLAPENAIEALQKIHPSIRQNNTLFKEAQKYYLYRSKGSLQKLLDFSLQYGQNSILSESYDPTFERIISMDNTSKFIFAIIVLHAGQVGTLTLKTIAEASVSPVVLNYDAIIVKLISDYELISEAEETYQVSHASLIDSWNNNKRIFEKYELLAYRNCINYYNDLLNLRYSSMDEKDQALLFLLRVYAKQEPENLPLILKKITGLVSERIRPETIWQYYIIFLDYIEDSEGEYRQILYEMAEFCFNQNLYKNCLYLLQILEKIPGESSTDRFMVFKINCLEYLELHKDAIALCKSQLEVAKSDRQIYIYNLLLMGCHRSLNQKKEYLECVSLIKTIENYKHYLEYGIFLRLSEIYMERDEALPYVEKSVAFFKEKQLPLQEAKSRITYAFLLAITTDPAKAMKEMNHCEKMLEPYHCWQNVIALNKASILMLQNKFGGEISDLLKKAELSTNSPFDLLLILVLQLINNIETNDLRNNEYLLKRIISSLNHETDKHLIALVSYDLSVVFHRLNEQSEAKKYREMAETVKQYNRSVACHLSNTSDMRTPILFETEWSIGFTFFWNVDYVEAILPG